MHVLQPFSPSLSRNSTSRAVKVASSANAEIGATKQQANKATQADLIKPPQKVTKTFIVQKKKTLGNSA